MEKRSKGTTGNVKGRRLVQNKESRIKSGEKKKRKIQADYYGNFYERILALNKSTDFS